MFICNSHQEAEAASFYSTGALWGSMWGILMAPAVFMLQPLGMLAMAGPIV